FLAAVRAAFVAMVPLGNVSRGNRSRAGTVAGAWRYTRHLKSEGAMTASFCYHEETRALQDQFDSRRIADRLEDKLARTVFTADDKAFIHSAMYFFLASAAQQAVEE